MLLLRQIQADIEGRLLSCPEFRHVDVSVVTGNGGKNVAVLRDLLQRVLTGLKITEGKAGLSVLILMPEIRIEEAMRTVPGPQIDLRCAVQVIENDEVNQGPKGTGITAESLAHTVLSLLHLWQPRGGVLLLADKDAVTVAEIDEEMPASIAYQVNFSTPMSTAPAARCIAPTPAYEAGALTLTGQSGAEHWFTTDGSFPRPAAQGSILYAGAVSLPVGTLVRAASYLPDVAGSDVIEFTTAA